MSLPLPEVPVICGPKGNQVAASYPNDLLTLTYWDLWCLIAAKHRFGSSMAALRADLVDRRLNRSIHSSWGRDQIEDLITLIDDLSPRIAKVGSVEEILATIPEKLLQKEKQKGIKNVTSTWGSVHQPSEPMLRSPRRILEKEAMRGMWPRLPVDPTPIAASLQPLFVPKKDIGYFPERSTFALSRKVEKAIEKELEKANSLFVMNYRAYRYAVYRAALTLYQEENSWDDSYGEMGAIGTEWIKGLLSFTPDDLCVAPRVLLKDILMFFCWEVYGLSDSEQAVEYIQKLEAEEQQIARDILLDIQARAAQGFQDYHADQAASILAGLRQS